MAYQAISNIPQGNVLLQGQRPIGRQQIVAAVQNHWGPGPGSSAQFDMDVAMRYGALTVPGSGELGGFLTRLFTVLYRAGIRYNITNNQGGEPPNWRYFGNPDPGIPIVPRGVV